MSAKKETTSQVIDPQKNIPKEVLTEISNLDEEGFAKLGSFLGKIYEHLSPEEQEYYKAKRLEEQKRIDDKNKKFNQQVESAMLSERFEIPRGSKKYYDFIGYDSQQYVELNTIANEADNIPKDKRGSPEYLNKEVETYKKMILFSVSNIPEAEINKIPIRELTFLYHVFKRKNEEPLPFLVNE